MRSFLVSGFGLLISIQNPIPAAEQEPPPPIIQFRNVIGESGIKFRHIIGSEAISNILETTGSGLSFCDYNGDGNLDLYVVNGNYYRDIHRTMKILRSFADRDERVIPQPGLAGGFNMSEILLAASIEPKKRVVMVRDDLKISPNPTRSYLQDQLVHIYYEIYGLALDDKGSTNYRIESTIYERERGWTRFKRLFGAGVERKASFTVSDDRYGTHSDVMFYETMNVSKLRPGNYELVLTVGDLNRDQEVRQTSDFKVITSEEELVELPVNRLYRNDGDGTFTDVTSEAGVGDPGYGMGASFGDYDGDGDQDLYVYNWGPNILYRNEGDGTFLDVTNLASAADSGWAIHSSFLDYDNDGDLDIWLANYLDFNPDHKVRRGLYSYKEGYRYFPGPRDYSAQPDRLFRNNGDGTFTEVGDQAGLNPFLGKAMSSAWSDYDDDGDLDFYVANDRQANHFYINNGDGTFTEIAEELGVAYDEDGMENGNMGCDWGDYDNDGLLDLFITSMIFEYNYLYHNDGDGILSEISKEVGLGDDGHAYVGWGNAMVDFDLDGDLDIFIANGDVHDYADIYSEAFSYRQPDSFYENVGGRFRNVSEEAGEYFTTSMVDRGAAFGDYDNDGDIDIALLHPNGPVSLLRNETPRKYHWLTIELTEDGLNRQAIGARALVYNDGRFQIREVKSNSSYMSQNDLRLHYGLGNHSSVDSIRVRWTDGSWQSFGPQAADRFLRVDKGIPRVLAREPSTSNGDTGVDQ
ncbi:CRTAC1 family protein [candidate division KSB1 bacterium]